MEYNISKFIDLNYELILSQSVYCWPMNFNNLDELRDRLIEEEMKYFVISSSYGLNGWVVSKTMNIEKKNVD
ncbi:hypothetical protein [Fusibacter sp. JL216-2]|uniref:hypothetical protein n=1 Tax=Fusibacter sp. JL216-2 TaxID=3071453 RepID=UPI003D33B436